MKTDPRWRRCSMRLAVAVLVSMVTVSGCKKPKTPAYKARVVNVLGRTESIPQEVIEGFQGETHIAVTVDAVPSVNAMRQKLASADAKYDVVLVPDYVAQSLITQNKLTPLDYSRISYGGAILPEFKDQPFDPGNRFTVPLSAGVIGIVYNAEKIKTPIKGFADVFKQENAGRIIAPDDNRVLAGCAILAGGGKIAEADPEKVRSTLAEWVTLIAKYDSVNPKADLLAGNSDIGIVSSGEAALLVEQDKRFKWVVPAEGTFACLDSFAVPVGAANRESAEVFINSCLRPDTGQQIALKLGSTSPNGEARKLMTPEQLGNPISYPPPPKEPLPTLSAPGGQLDAIERLAGELRGAK